MNTPAVEAGGRVGTMMYNAVETAAGSRGVEGLA
jgi:hypothetical protein